MSNHFGSLNKEDNEVRNMNKVIHRGFCFCCPTNRSCCDSGPNQCVVILVLGLVVFVAGIALIISGAVLYHKTNSSNKLLKGECILSKSAGLCLVTCYRSSSTVLTDVQVNCAHKTYRLKFTGDNIFTATPVLSTDGYLAMLIIGAIIFVSCLVGLLVSCGIASMTVPVFS